VDSFKKKKIIEIENHNINDVLIMISLIKVEEYITDSDLFKALILMHYIYIYIYIYI
jgi:hypothetical protein